MLKIPSKGNKNGFKQIDIIFGNIKRKQFNNILNA